MLTHTLSGVIVIVTGTFGNHDNLAQYDAGGLTQNTGNERVRANDGPPPEVTEVIEVTGNLKSMPRDGGCHFGLEDISVGAMHTLLSYPVLYLKKRVAAARIDRRHLPKRSVKLLGQGGID